MATPLLTQWYGWWSGEIGKYIEITKLVEWPVVDNVPALLDVLYTGHS